MNTTFIAMEIVSIIKIFLIFVGLYVLMRILMTKESLITRPRYEPEMWALNQNKIPLNAHTTIHMSNTEYDEVFQTLQNMQSAEDAPIGVTNWSVEFIVHPDPDEDDYSGDSDFFSPEKIEEILETMRQQENEEEDTAP